MMINRMKTQNWEADSHTSSPLCWQVSCCQSDSLIDNSKNRKGHKSCLPRHLCFPRKSKFIETKSSACCTLRFFFWQVYFLGPWALMFSISLSRYPEYTNLFSIWNTETQIKSMKNIINSPFRGRREASGKRPSLLRLIQRVLSQSADSTTIFWSCRPLISY